jgi:hypothetical protein
MLRRKRLNPPRASRPAPGRIRKAFKSSLRLAVLVVLGFVALMVWGNVDDLRTENRQAVEQVAKARLPDTPEVKQAVFDQRFDLPQTDAGRINGLHVDRGPETQATRKVLLQRLTNEGIFIRAALPGGSPWVWVGPTFYALDFETKQEMVSIVYCYYLDGSDPTERVRIFDGHTNKEIGDYNPNSPGIALRLF